MRLHRLSVNWLVLAFGLASAVAPAQAQDSYKIEVLKEAPPSGLAPAVREALASEGFRVLDGENQPFAEIWLRKAVPAKEKPGAANGAIQFPFLTEGELLGALRFTSEGHDYRDQPIAKGVYTLRYGIQPVNGDHLGVSVFRDYLLLLPAAKDTSLASLARKPLEERSAESAGTSHPAILMLLKPSASAPKAPTMIHDEEKNTWGAALPFQFEVEGAAAPSPLNLLLIVVGAAMA